MNGVIKPKFDFDGKQWWFYIATQTLRTHHDSQRYVFDASNGWKIIIGFNGVPRINIQSKAIFGLGSLTQYDELGTLIEASSMIVALIKMDILEACEEASNGEWIEKWIK